MIFRPLQKHLAAALLAEEAARTIHVDSGIKPVSEDTVQNFPKTFHSVRLLREVVEKGQRILDAGIERRRRPAVARPDVLAGGAVMDHAMVNVEAGRRGLCRDRALVGMFWFAAAGALPRQLRLIVADGRGAIWTKCPLAFRTVWCSTIINWHGLILVIVIVIGSAVLVGLLHHIVHIGALVQMGGD